MNLFKSLSNKIMLFLVSNIIPPCAAVNFGEQSEIIINRIDAHKIRK